jgi:hypothetical protein
MLGICTPQVHEKRRPLAAMAPEETEMSIKGLKEALARKQAQQQPDGTAKDSAATKITPTAPVRVGGSKPEKKAAGRGR